MICITRGRTWSKKPVRIHVLQNLLHTPQTALEFSFVAELTQYKLSILSWGT